MENGASSLAKNIKFVPKLENIDLGKLGDNILY